MSSELTGQQVESVIRQIRRLQLLFARGTLSLKIAVMQPYFFPYIGYFQMLKCVDHFVFLDDVNFIKRGWINRNQFRVGHSAHLFTVALSAASQNKKINKTYLANKSESRRALLSLLEHNYSNAKYKAACLDVIAKTFDETESDTISELAWRSVVNVADYLDLDTTFSFASEHDVGEARGSSRIIALCESLGASHYLNLPGGKDLYDHSEFYEYGIDLGFVDVKLQEYPSEANPWLPSLSVLDLIIHNGDASKQYL